MARGVADVVEVVVLAAGAHALLRRAARRVVARARGPAKTSLNWFMPALVKSRVVSPAGIRDEEGTTPVPALARRSRGRPIRISRLVIARIVLSFSLSAARASHRRTACRRRSRAPSRELTIRARRARKPPPAGCRRLAGSSRASARAQPPPRARAPARDRRARRPRGSPPRRSSSGAIRRRPPGPAERARSRRSARASPTVVEQPELGRNARRAASTASSSKPRVRSGARSSPAKQSRPAEQRGRRPRPPVSTAADPAWTASPRRRHAVVRAPSWLPNSNGDSSANGVAPAAGVELSTPPSPRGRCRRWTGCPGS